jgi:hypothetical protein
MPFVEDRCPKRLDTYELLQPDSRQLSKQDQDSSWYMKGGPHREKCYASAVLRLRCRYEEGGARNIQGIPRDAWVGEKVKRPCLSASAASVVGWSHTGIDPLSTMCWSSS